MAPFSQAHCAEAGEKVGAGGSLCFSSLLSNVAPTSHFQTPQLARASSLGRSFSVTTADAQVVPLVPSPPQSSLPKASTHLGRVHFSRTALVSITSSIHFCSFLGRFSSLI